MFRTIQSLYSHEGCLLSNIDSFESKGVMPDFRLLRLFLYGRCSERVYINPLIFGCVATAGSQNTQTVEQRENVSSSSKESDSVDES